MHNTTWLEFDAAALQHNLAQVRALAPQSAILAMLKADGYGHGADWVAEVLAGRVQGFGAARIEEAIALRRSQADARILLLGTLLDAEILHICSTQRFDVVIHRLEDAELLAALPLPAPVRVWLKLNIGMNRLGMHPVDFSAAHRLLNLAPSVASITHMGHFSDADNLNENTTREQCKLLTTTSASLGEAPLSAANSAAIIAHPQSHLDWVRPGIMLYGDDPTGSLPDAQKLQAVMQFKSRVIAVKEVVTGDGVGYNRRWRANQPCRIATVAAGYADGYPRNAPDGTPVVVRGQRARLAGRVSMDLLTIDVSDIDGVRVGDEVELWGNQLSASEVAEHCETISYELFTRVTRRVARCYPKGL